MRKCILSVAAVAFVATTAQAYLGEIVSSFRSPAGTHTRGLARAPGYLYVMDGEHGTIYQTRPSTGSIFKSYLLPWISRFSGLAFSTPSYLWVGRVELEEEYNIIFRVKADTGSFYSSWPPGFGMPYGLAPWCTGDGGAGTSYLFVTNEHRQLVIRDVKKGVVWRLVPLVYDTKCDCAFDWRNNLIWQGHAGYIYGFTPSGPIMASFPSPAGSPRGLAYYDQHLWVACAANGYIYRVHCPQNFTAVGPASLGKVRAIFR